VQPENVRFRFEIRGSDGWLRLTSKHSYGFQAGNLKLTSNVLFVEPAAVSGGTMETAINVGEIYAQLVHDLHEGTYKTPGFQHALHNARLIEAVRRAAERGERQNTTSHALEQRRRGATPSCINKQVSKESSDERSNEPPELRSPSSPAQAGQ
jgi:hypothetical protein